MSQLSITWLGHGTILLRTPGGKRVLVDPWLRENPACPDALKKPPKVDLILATHGHSDHVGDMLAVSRESGGPPVVGILELCTWLTHKGVPNCMPMNKGGTLDVAGLKVTMVDARHSSSAFENGTLIYLGEPAGFVLALEDGLSVYVAGDTSVFGDMRLIGELYKPAIAVLPIGDRFTMGPREAAKACELLAVSHVVPVHWGTFPMLTGTLEAFKALVEPRGIQVLELRPGETTD